MLDYKVRIGLVPLRRDCTPRPGIFNWEFAEERGRKAVKGCGGPAGADRCGAGVLRGGHRSSGAGGPPLKPQCQ